MKIGIAGNGMIAEKMLGDIARVKTVSATAICVLPRSRQKGAALAAENGLELYTDYEEFLRQGEFDVVYIGVINCEHYTYAKQALLAGKHVLCEKPFTVRSCELKELIALAKERGLFLWESMRVFYSPVVKAAAENLSHVGNIKLIQCNMSRISSRYRRYEQGIVLPVFDPALAGGCLYDINIYNLCFVISLFGRPKALHSYRNYGFNGVDTSGTVIMEYDGFLAVCSAAKDSTSPSFASIQGTQGCIWVEGAVSQSEEAYLMTEDARTCIGRDPHADGFYEELCETERQFASHNLEACYQLLETSQLLMEVLEEAAAISHLPLG